MFGILRLRVEVLTNIFSAALHEAYVAQKSPNSSFAQEILPTRVDKFTITLRLPLSRIGRSVLNKRAGPRTLILKADKKSSAEKETG